MQTKQKNLLNKKLPLRSLLALPANSRTSAVRYSNIAALYTAAVAPTRPWFIVRALRCLWIRPTGNWRPARDERDTDFALDLPESFPALPPALKINQRYFILKNLLSYFLCALMLSQYLTYHFIFQKFCF